MSKKEDIETLFSSKLEHYQAKVDAKVWDSLSSKMNTKTASGNNIESLFKGSLANYKVTPSEGVWSNISSLLGHSKPFFSIHNLSVWIMGLLFVVGLNSDGITSKIFFEENPSTYYVDNLNKEDSLQYSSADLSQSEVLKKEEMQVKAGVGAYDSASDKGTYNSGSEAVPLSKNNSSLKANQNRIEKGNGSDNLKVADNQNAISLVDNSSLEANTEFGDNSESRDEVNVNMPLHEVVVDTLVYYDTVTVFETNKTPINNGYKALKKSTDKAFSFSLSPYVGLSANRMHLSTPEEGYNSLSEKAFSNYYSKNVGVLFNVNYKKWRFSTGLEYLNIEEFFDYKTVEVSYEEKTRFSLKENGFFKEVVCNQYPEIFEKEILTYDTLSMDFEIKRRENQFYVTIDTVWTYKIDTNAVVVKDTSYVTQYDTVRTARYDTTYYQSMDTSFTNYYYNVVNQYTYLEIPFYLSYSFQLEKWQFTPSLGVHIGLMLNAKGKGISFKNYNEIYDLKEPELPLANILLSLNLGLEISYQLSHNVHLFLRPTYRTTLNSMYSTSGINKKAHHIGGNLGVRIDLF